uniref:Uncharacterized protein n=1 Tax=Glossina pallidipes TaxID=7398 RepID=A0A1B0ADA3_GLOPL
MQNLENLTASEKFIRCHEVTSQPAELPNEPIAQLDLDLSLFDLVYATSKRIQRPRLHAGAGKFSDDDENGNNDDLLQLLLETMLPLYLSQILLLLLLFLLLIFAKMLKLR